MSKNIMGEQDAVAFVIVNNPPTIAGYTWLIEWTTTSFYVKSLYQPLQTAKVSIHGADPGHPGLEHFRLDFDHEKPAAKAAKAGGGWSTDALELPLFFPGRRINGNTVHVMRFSAESEMYAAGIPSAPNPPLKPKATLHATIPAPLPGRVTHVDVFLSDDAPYWPENEELLDAEDAGIGPISNSAGLHLTMVSYGLAAGQEPDPLGDMRAGAPLEQCVRGIGWKLDATGFLWACEKIIPTALVMTSPTPPAPWQA
jgi:hypothetical protein